MNIVITVDAVDITADVVIADTVFIGQVNGSPGQATIRVKDDGHTHAFITGKEVILTINSVRHWGGYIMRALRTYAFEADRTTDADTTARFWILECNDYNILFQKRVAYLLSDPDQVTPFMQYPANTQDTVVLDDILTNYFDISGDGVDISSGITNVGTVGDLRFHAGSVSHQLGQVIGTVARETGAVFYIDPDKVLRYVDAETVTNPLTLGDVAGTEEDFGYRSVEIIANGTNLINDMYQWGAGLGSNRMTFSHVRDAQSVALHGIWQHGDMAAGLYHQDKVDRRANSFVYGTPQSLRGHKDDSVTWILTVFLPHWRLGEIVPLGAFTFNTGTHDVIEPFEDAGFPGPIISILPIRRVEITFISPTQAQWRLTLSYEIDLPWSFFEFPPLPGIPIPRIDIPGPPSLPPLTRIFDDFNNRTHCDDAPTTGFFPATWGYAHTGLVDGVTPRIWHGDIES